MLFKRKKSPDVVDLTDMRKRGLLKEHVPETNKEGVIDFSDSAGSSAPSHSAESSSPNMDFLGSLAGASASESMGGSITENLREARQRNLGNSEIHEVKIKAEDNEYKIRALEDKIRELEEKLRRFEQ